MAATCADGGGALLTAGDATSRGRRKQSKPQRMSAVDPRQTQATATMAATEVSGFSGQLTSDSDTPDHEQSPMTTCQNASVVASPPIDCHVCGLCGKQLYALDEFVLHKQHCVSAAVATDPPTPSQDESMTRPPVDLSADDARLNGGVWHDTLADETSPPSEDGTRMQDSLETAFTSLQQNQSAHAKLMQLYAQLTTPSAISPLKDDVGRTPNLSVSAAGPGPLFPSPPSSNEEGSHKMSDRPAPRPHGFLCTDCTTFDDTDGGQPQSKRRRRTRRFESDAAWLWHRLTAHADEFSLRCNACEQQFRDLPEAYRHAARPADCTDEHDLRARSVDAERRDDRALLLSPAVSAPPPTDDHCRIETLSVGDKAHAQPHWDTMMVKTENLADHADEADGPLDLSRHTMKQQLNEVDGVQENDMPNYLSSAYQNPFQQHLNELRKLQELQQNHADERMGEPNFRGAGSTDGGGPNNFEVINDVDDSDWEKYMELNQVDENERIRQLVGDKPTPVTDPNQCLICRRILSCKSALQMHYRTHTGDRPFKCKICQRAFTTKGNLKTHMGVHRAKHVGGGGGSSAMIHQCPICQKRFFNGFLLQQHVAAHTSQLMQHNGNGAPAGKGADHSNTAVAMDLRNMTAPVSSYADSFGDLANMVRYSMPPSINFSQPSPAPQQPPLALPSSYPPAPPGFNPFLLPPPTSIGNMVAAAAAAAAAAANFQQQQPQLPTVASAAAAASATTTCNVCYKTFACNSALEIHYRSHTKDRPFKCNVCHRGFSTKGNMKQHLLTHKIRDLSSADGGDAPLAATHAQHAAEQMNADGWESTEDGQIDSVSNDSSPKLSVDVAHSPDVKPLLSSTMPNLIDKEALVSNNNNEPDHPPQHPQVSQQPPTAADPSPLESIQKMWAQTELPPPRQTPILSKHQCGVCFKHFSSSSALQIHMRTHTGDKPFKCAACGRAFTTKGNLKVHMGTHVWHNPHRRGRRIFDFAAGGGGGQHSNGGADSCSSASPPPSAASSLPDETTSRSIAAQMAAKLAELSSAASSDHSNVFSNGGECAAGGFVSPPGLFSSAPPLPTGGGGRFAPIASLGSPPFPFPTPPSNRFFGPSAVATPSSNVVEQMMWMWRTVCSVCQKMFPSSGDLEEHLKLHLNGHISGAASESAR